jgi:hypothetical protein
MSMRRWFIVAGVVVLGLALAPGTSAAQSPKRDDPSPLPFYARSVTGIGEEWSVVYFYRPVECIPRDFNLLAFFDAPRAFECEPMTVDTFAVWETGPGLDPFGPRQARARGLGAVPIWFVRTDDLDRAESDGVLTIPELEALDPLMGHASVFTETLHPAGAVENVVLVVNARGRLEDGRSFSLHITLHFDRRIVRVTFER